MYMDEEICMNNADSYDNHPFSSDYLQATWEELLRACGYHGRALLRVITTDIHGQETVAYAPEDFHQIKVDSIAAFCGENGHNLRVTGYLYNPWWSTLSAVHWGLMGLLLAGCTLLYFVQDDVMLLWILFQKRRRAGENTEDELKFDVARGQLVRGSKVVQLTAMPARLLQGLLEAEGHQLSVQEIHLLLWPEERDLYPHRLHTCITRLRGYLAKISDWKVVNKGQAYRLVFDDNQSSR